MPKITIKNLNTEINRRIRLIKTPTSIVEVGEQNGAVVETADYVGICLSPFSNPTISCEGAENSFLLYTYEKIGSSNEDERVYVIDGVVLNETEPFPSWITTETVDIEVNPPEGFESRATVKWNNSDSISHRIEIISNNQDYISEFAENSTIVEFEQYMHYGVCLAPQDTPVFTCTPETESDHVQLSKVRSGFPSATFVNVPFNVYENGIQIGSNLTLNSLNDMGQVGLTCVFENMEQTLMSVYNNWPQGRSVRLQPVENFFSDVDVTQGNGMVDEDSFWLCLAPAAV